ncbi:MAG TPA: carboxypeptidase regulatory-like domain-containing protein [Vicinamibacterales bacterium]|nr:carboxypeptidase regulatory-like domain-containing protein [Vicinamibacterales bacterium]
MTLKRFVFGCCCLLFAPTAYAQVQTGSIVGSVTDASNSVLPGVLVSLAGERLIGGTQTFTTDATGTYRFDRLPPGDYLLKFELQGFKTVERAEIRVNAAFVATVNVKLEVGSVSETITVTGESPTVDTKSNLQQTVMSQDILEGIPTGRDPWSLAKLIPGVQVATYDVGGTQSMQQSSMSSHGSNTSDVSFNIDGATVNWPGSGGGSTMLYYDQGMFEEVNYMTSAIPAEQMAGGLSINMVTKTAGNAWRANLRYSFSNNDLQSENHLDIQRTLPTFLGNPTLKTYDANLSGGGAIVRDRVWVNGTIRKWIVNKLTNARNLDGSQALDDNDLKNYSAKGTISLTTNQKLMVSYLWNNKIRGHRRDSNDLIPDIAAVRQTNPASTTQVKYNGIRRRLVFESGFSVMDGQTNYLYQPGTPPEAIRRVDNSLGTADFASNREEHQPNSRHQFDNVVSYNASRWGEHFVKGGVQWGRLFYEQDYTVQGHHHVEYSNGVPTQVRLWNTPTDQKNVAHVLGFFAQDSWSVGRRLTLNLGMRFDNYTGIIPEESAAGGPFIEARTIARTEVMDQKSVVWRTGMVYDPMSSGRTALKASYSRYGLQTGIDRVTAVNPLSPGSKTCPWTDPNGDGKFQTSEINFAQCSAFSGGISTFYAADGVDWPYSDEVTAGVEREIMRDMRVGAMFYYRTNRKQLGVRNIAVPTSAYTPFTLTIPNGPGGTVRNPQSRTVTVFNLAPALVSARNNIRDNDPYLDTDYRGIEFTAAKRFSRNWQMVAGLTIGKNEGGLNAVTGGGQSATADLNDPNVTVFSRGIIGNDSKVGFRMSGSYRLPGEVTLAGSVVSNTGYPYTSTYDVTRPLAAMQGVSLTRSSQTVFLSERGEERLQTVTMVDLRVSRRFRFAGHSFSPQLDLFNITNASTVVSVQNAVGGTYLDPREILSPRIVRVGFSLDF